MLSTRSDLDDYCASNTCLPETGPAREPARYVNLYNTLQTQGTITTVGYVVGGIGIAAGAILLLTAPKKPDSPTKASIEPWIGLQSAGLRGTF